MRVYISGMSSTGKTTLINYIKDNLDMFKAFTGTKNIVFVDELARGFFEKNNKGYSTYEELLQNYGDCMEYWGELISEFTNTVRNLSAANYVYIIDRSPIDYLINLTLNYSAGDQVSMMRKSKEYAEYCDKLSRVGSSDLVLMTNPYKAPDEVEDDGFRPIELQYRRSMERSLFRLAATSSNVIILPDSTEKRFVTVVNEVNKNLEGMRGRLKGIEQI